MVKAPRHIAPKARAVGSAGVSPARFRAARRQRGGASGRTLPGSVRAGGDARARRPRSRAPPPAGLCGHGRRCRRGRRQPRGNGLNLRGSAGICGARAAAGPAARCCSRRHDANIIAPRRRFVQQIRRGGRGSPATSRPAGNVRAKRPRSREAAGKGAPVHGRSRWKAASRSSINRPNDLSSRAARWISMFETMDSANSRPPSAGSLPAAVTARARR